MTTLELLEKLNKQHDWDYEPLPGCTWEVGVYGDEVIECGESAYAEITYFTEEGESDLSTLGIDRWCWQHLQEAITAQEEEDKKEETE